MIAKLELEDRTIKKHLFSLMLCSALGLLSCNNNKTVETVQHAISKMDTIATDPVLFKNDLKEPPPNFDSIERFVVDDYPVTDDMINQQSVDGSFSFLKTSGLTKSYDKAWFTNENRQQTLIFEIYTDGHRLVTFHFYTHNILPDIIKAIELHNNQNGLATYAQKLKDFKGFLNQAVKIDTQYFTSDKGLKLGDPPSKALAIYGTPHQKMVNKGVEKLVWHYVGDLLYDGKENLKGKPLAKHNYGHHATLYFKEGRLIAQILYNEIP